MKTQIKEGIEAKNETFDYSMECLQGLKDDLHARCKNLREARKNQATLAQKVECERRERGIAAISNTLNLLTFEIEDKVCDYLQITLRE